MRRVTSRQNAIVARFRSAAGGEASAGLLLDGVHLVSDAIAAGLRIREAAVTADAIERQELQQILLQLADAGVEVVSASPAVMSALSPVRSSSPIVALADRPDAPDPAARAGVAPLAVVAVDVQDPGNMGAIIRVAEAGGATSVVAAGSSADPFGWKALRGSMGSALRMPVEVEPDAAKALAAARRLKLRIVATLSRGGKPPGDVDYTVPVAIVVGSEGPGLDHALLESADERVTIPMEAPVESLNAAVAAALIVYEARRQRALLRI